MTTYTLMYERYLLSTCEFQVKANTLDEAIAAAEELECETEANWECQFDNMTEPRLRSVFDKSGVELVCVNNPFYVPRSELEACLMDQWGRDPALAPTDKQWVAEVRRHRAMWDCVAPDITEQGRAEMERCVRRLHRDRKNGA